MISEVKPLGATSRKQLFVDCRFIDKEQGMTLLFVTTAMFFMEDVGQNRGGSNTEAEHLEIDKSPKISSGVGI